MLDQLFVFGAALIRLVWRGWLQRRLRARVHADVMMGVKQAFQLGFLHLQDLGNLAHLVLRCGGTCRRRSIILR